MSSSLNRWYSWAGLALLGCVATGVPSVRADVFHYKDGRTISGTITAQAQREINQIPVTVWTVRIADGAYVQVIENELKRGGHDKPSESEREYVAKIDNLPQTAQAHCDMAAWCRQHGMLSLEKAHYRRALDLDPDSNVARAASGYKKDKNGIWVKKEKIYGELRGKVRFGGQWRFPESVAIEQAKQAADQEIAPLKKDLSRWHSSASFGRTPKMRQTAMASISQIQDPRTIGILSGFLLEARKRPPVNVRLLYVNVLGRFKRFESAQALATASITDPEDQVRNACLDALREFGRDVAVPKYISYLQNDNNDWVNRAASGLGQFNPPSAMLPLIDALITEHLTVVGGGPQMNASTQGAFSLGGGPKKKMVPVENSGVHATLSQITGQNFGYNEKRWLAWYASIYGAPSRDLRRDP